jgi:hypothetical protein
VAHVHFILQKKGGVGKSFVSSVFTQYLIERKYLVKGFDTDPTNNSFSRFENLKITYINILRNNSGNKEEEAEIDPRFFDNLMESIFEINKVSYDAHAVVDTGSSCYIALKKYLKENDAFELLKENDHLVYLHVPIMGGQDTVDTAKCFDELAEDFPGLPFYLWLNPFHGEISFEGKPFERFQTYMEHKSLVAGVVRIPDKQKTTFGKDLELMMIKNMTFAQSFNSNLPLMVRQRLKMFWNELSAQMSEICKFAGIEYARNERMKKQQNGGVNTKEQPATTD